MKKQLLKSALIAVAGVGLLASGAMGAMISGAMGLTGNLKLTGGGDFATATTIDFLSNLADIDTNTAFVNGASGDFISILGATATMKDFQFDPFVANNALWTAGIFSFDMQSLNVATHNSTTLSITGVGSISAAGYDLTPGTWSLTTQNSPIAGITASYFTWSAGTTAVPEPATMLLFGTGMIGLAGIARRKNISA